MKLLSDLIVWDKYARYDLSLSRRETWDEIVDRTVNFFHEVNENRKSLGYDGYSIPDMDRIDKFIRYKKVLPSMRVLQYAGQATHINNARAFNCSAIDLDTFESFSEALFLLLSGSGVGYSVRKEVVGLLPSKHFENRGSINWTIDDSIEGWADALKVSLKAFADGHTVDFDYSLIRPQGSPLKTSGGSAPGPEPLRKALESIANILSHTQVGEKLTPFQCHEIMCFAAMAVQAGGSRRSAMIVLFDVDDIEMMGCKTGNWWRDRPHLAASNNSAVLSYETTSKEEFFKIMQFAESCGEPGVIWRESVNILVNPCGEISLKSGQFCNLTTINFSSIEDQSDFEDRTLIASMIGTLQATLTNFKYLRPIWKETTDTDALIGVSMTGLARNDLDRFDFATAAEMAKVTNALCARRLGINKASRVTTTKPEGTSSLVLGSSSGVHAWYDKYYIRRVTLNKYSTLYQHLQYVMPDLIEDKISNSNEAFLCVPVKAPTGAITRHDESLDELYTRVIKINTEWVRNGHRSGEYNNVSATLNVKPDEYSNLFEKMWEDRHKYSGLSVFPHFDGAIPQSPFESITEETYNEMVKKLVDVNFNHIYEYNDSTNLADNMGCAGGKCEL